ncbi:hypothetical protein VNO78_01168 [Psophocarpus tetragonolobus]|uniref:Uncharacterized protein n=1 Tax=Psophocarpus tetragonolobus TaxID=3891 RepID=A0AAN9SYV0_PSOTE
MDSCCGWVEILLALVFQEETMLKQSTNRNQKTKSFKVKLGFKIFILIVVGIWLIYQLKSSHEKKSYEESSEKVFEDLKDGPEMKKLGRKGLQPWTNYKPYELMDDAEENEHEREDDVVVIHDGDKVEEEESEEVEDLIDEQDKEKEEQNEDEDGEDMAKQMEGMGLLEDEGHDDEGKEDTHATSEKHNKDYGASRAVMRVTKSLGSEFEFGGLRKVKEGEVGNSKRIGTEKQKKILDTSN